MIWAPKSKQFAQEVIEECAAFPFGDNDDLVDSTTQAVMRFRQGGLISHPEDYIDPPTSLDDNKIYY
jgi:phage terminase large subunit-like protein